MRRDCCGGRSCAFSEGVFGVVIRYQQVSGVRVLYFERRATKPCASACINAVKMHKLRAGGMMSSGSRCPSDV